MSLNLLAAEADIVARLTAKLADQMPKVHVLTAADVAGVLQEQQLTPAVHVVYSTSKVTEARYDGKTARMAQTWLAVVVTRNARNLVSGSDARNETGELAGAVFVALAGHKPASCSKPLIPVTPPGGGYSGGFAYLPLAFETEIVISAP